MAWGGQQNRSLRIAGNVYRESLTAKTPVIFTLADTAEKPRLE